MSNEPVTNCHDLKPVRCKCGAEPEVVTMMSVAKGGMIQGRIECPDCGETVRGKQWHWDRDDAVDDAIEEWNAVMEEDHE